MSTLFEHQVFVIGTAAVAPNVIVALDQAFPRDDGVARNPADITMVACPMSESGLGPATHYGAAFSITEKIRSKLEGMGLASAPGVMYWRCNNPGGELTATNHEQSKLRIGENWDWEKCIRESGIKQLSVLI